MEYLNSKDTGYIIFPTYHITEKSFFESKYCFFLDKEFCKLLTQHTIEMTPENLKVEILLSDHCNLNCQMCNHFSPIAVPKSLKLSEFKKDIQKLSKLTKGALGTLYLMGGEPLLNPELLDIIICSRQYFKETSIQLYTNGIKLISWENHSSGNLWEVCHENNVSIQVTKYPIKLDVHKIFDLSKKYNVTLDIFTNAINRAYLGEKYSVKMKLDPDGAQPEENYIYCHQRIDCTVLHRGNLYPCPVIATICHFNNYFNLDFKLTEKDVLKIHCIDTYEKIKMFLESKPSFCKFCDLPHRTVHKWELSRKKKDEWI